MNKFAFRAYDHRIYYVNIDLRHHYGISVAEAQTFLLAKSPQRRGARRNGCFRRSFVNKVWPKRAFFLEGRTQEFQDSLHLACWRIQLYR